MLKRILFLVLFCGQLFPQTTLNGSASASGVVSLGTAGTGVALVSITISPQNPVISYVSQQSFTANGTYSNSTSGDVTNLATWTSSNPAVATNVGPNFQCVARGSVTVTASYQGVNGTTTLTCQSPTMSPLSGSTVQSASSQTIMQYTGANGVSPFTFSISGQPSGWTLSSTGCPSGQVNCSLIGIPATVGTYNFFVQATDNLGNTACAPPGCAISVNVYAAGAEDDKYCTLVGSVETITGLAMDGPANPMQNCNFTELLSTAGLAYNSLSTPVGTGTGTTVHVCSVSSTVVPCGSLIPVAGGGANAATVYCYSSGFIAWGAAGCTTLGNGPFYTKQVQGAINFVSGQINNVNTGLGNLCGALISVQAYYLPGGIGAATQAVYQEPTVNPPANLNCGPDFGQPWVWLATDQLNLSTLAIVGLAPGNRISPAYVGQGSITGRPAYAQVAGGNYPAMPMLKCEMQQPAGENCTFLNSQSGAIISGLRVMGIDFASPHGRENTFDLYGNPACSPNDNNTPQCSPGSTGPEVFVGCQVVSKTICLSPISGTVNTTNSASGACPSNCVTWQSWNSGVSGAEQYNFSMFIPGDPVNIGATQYTVGTIYSNTLMSVTTAPGTQTGATYTPYTGSYNVVFDRDLFEACDDHTFATCYDIMETGLQMQSGQHLSVIDSYFIGFNCLYAIGPCTDSHPILGGLAENSNDFAQKVVNNYLEASGENFFWGGGNSLGYPADIEIRRNHLYKPLTWKVDTPLYPGTVNDAWVNKQNIGAGATPYVSAPSCNVSLPQQGSCTDGQSCAATCTAISTGGGTSWTITDVTISNGGSGYGIGVKGNGKTYATNPSFTFTDTSGTYSSCNVQLSGTANVSAPNGSGISTVTWLSGDKFTEKAFRGTNASIQFTSNPNGGSWTGTPNTFAVTYISSTSVTFTFSGTQVLPVNNVIWTSVFPTRGDCVYPLIGFYNVKNDGEVKNGIRILEEGNVFENNWNGQSDQAGQTQLWDPKNANDGCPQCQISDLTYRYNFTRNSTEGMQIAIATATQCAMTPCLPVAMARLSFHDDVFDAMNGYQWVTGSAPVTTFADTCAEITNAQSPAYASSFIKINHITCLGTEPWTASALTSGSFLELFYSANYGANGTTPAVLQGVTLENSIGAGGVKNYAANSNGAISCTTEACKDHSTMGSTSPTAAALDSLLSSSFLGTPSGGVYPANIVTAVILPNGSVDTSGTAVNLDATSGPNFFFNSGMVGSLITINNVNYQVATYVDASDITISTSAGTQTNVAFGFGAYNCSVAPTSVTLTGGGASVGATAKFSITGSAVTKIYPTDPGAGYTSVPTVSFNGTCTNPPYAQAFIGGQNNAGTSAWCFDHNFMPGGNSSTPGTPNAWPSVTAMYGTGYPTQQGDTSGHNGCDSPTGGGNLGSISGSNNSWESVGFVNFVRDSAGNECSTYLGAFGQLCGPSSNLPAQTGDLHLSLTSPGHNAANDGTDIGACADLVLGYNADSHACTTHLPLGTPSPYTGISISGGYLQVPQ